MTTAGPAAPERRVECRRRCVPNSAAWTRPPRRARPPAGHRRRRGPSQPWAGVLAGSRRSLGSCLAIVGLPPTKEWWKGDAINPYPILVVHGVTVEAGGGSVVGGR